jgi:hypothetical protein
MSGNENLWAFDDLANREIDRALEAVAREYADRDADYVIEVRLRPSRGSDHCLLTIKHRSPTKPLNGGAFAVRDTRGSNAVSVEQSFGWLSKGMPTVETMNFSEVTADAITRRARSFAETFFKTAPFRHTEA